VKKKLATETVEVFSWNDLTTVEQANLDYAVATVKRVRTLDLNDIEIASFRSKKLDGLFSSGTQRISLSRQLLADRARTLLVLVHEVAHRAGEDGAVDHVDAIENIWSAIVTHLEKATAS